jgi:hypothetical protein
MASEVCIESGKLKTLHSCQTHWMQHWRKSLRWERCSAMFGDTSVSFLLCEVMILALIHVVMYLCPLADGQWAMSWYQPFATLSSTSRDVSSLSPSVSAADLCVPSLQVTRDEHFSGWECRRILEVPCRSSLRRCRMRKLGKYEPLDSSWSYTCT